MKKVLFNRFVTGFAVAGTICGHSQKLQGFPNPSGRTEVFPSEKAWLEAIG